jgi:F0F1-type ATP synthase assembly protein I
MRWRGTAELALPWGAREGASMGLIGPEGSRQLKLAGRFLGVGFELAASIFVGLFAGRWLDGTLHTTFLQYVGLLIGLASGFRSFYKLARTAQAQLSDNSSDSSDPRPP